MSDPNVVVQTGKVISFAAMLKPAGAKVGRDADPAPPTTHEGTVVELFGLPTGGVCDPIASNSATVPPSLAA